MDYSQVLSHRFVGSGPSNREDIDRLKEESSVKAVVNLQTEDDFSYLEIDWPVMEAPLPRCRCGS